uniref:Probable intron-encoded endonuclease LAGLIDADG n=1 Tax=Claviceps purpurea TaxID=5111 RepID=I7ICQ8_CLAPU|nr:probable intron-encoded endonuclease LAGLIDADG [Claviceps purpurea]
MAMFMGFVDGDGYIDVGEQKQYLDDKTMAKSTIRVRLVIALHKRDLSLLEYFVNTLGVGKIDFHELVKFNKVRVIFSKRDLITVIIPLIKKYGLEFLTSQRSNQYAKVIYILENSIISWVDFKYEAQLRVEKSVQELVNLDYFADWLVGFTMAEGSFGMKATGSAFYQLKQKGKEHVNLLKAAALLILGEETKKLFNPDAVDAYQLSLGSKNDIRLVLCFFTSPDHHPLYGYKREQFITFLAALKTSKRYSAIAAEFNG